jgi:trans-2,3-dihydro-3-hydroxyanthranilate isomerase
MRAMKTREGAPLTRVRLSPPTLRRVQDDAEREVRDLEYDVVDVFTDHPFGGNPLAVVHGTAGLPDDALQALAREFNLSETAFPTPVGDDAYELRIFTPVTELPFAGHPSLGAAWALRARGQVRGRALQQTCAAGTMPVRFDVDGRVRLTGGRPRLSDPVEDRAAAAALAAVGLAPSDLAGPPARVAGTGLDFCYLLVRPDAVARCVADVAGLRRAGAALRAQVSGPLGGVVVAAWEGGAVHARVFADDIGVPEDPATGSAALGLSAALVAAGLLPGEGRSQYDVAQGAEVGRPSALSCAVEAVGGRAVRCEVAGGVVPVARGTILRPR